MTVGGAVAEMTRLLTPHVGADWDVRAGSLDWSCWETAAHIAHDLTAYAMQLSAGTDDAYLPLDLVVRPGTPPARLLQIVQGCGRLLTAAVDAAGPDARAWHWGPTDPTGFAALGMNETLVHTYDIAQGLGLDWLPPEDAARTILDRLFPDAPTTEDHADMLLRCTGRRGETGPDWTLRAARG
ncbi:maleylpyruvate isomerase N-terminal domain-containing protein [Actinoplanes sp. NBRC 103695]|uniref:maleylpyruvate isomerase N-terminal domain-containing protein n=1 Tax=Actinoplanes sp. NBRC 103695 TaxID=3032202 RepID=UPI0024A4AA77|nr:maleylpyruvate isomerase N-terminal domain-containing protein [Actinoplanes sp. NBRC 103695]GLY95167.1 hypothetical protein Acsp02_24220 [Actinoplanes sp. NBRC 103695]